MSGPAVFREVRDLLHRFRVLRIRIKDWRATAPDTALFAAIEAAKGKSRIFVLLAAESGNLGDRAIVAAQAQLLGRLRPQAHIFVVPLSQSLHFMETFKDSMTDKDVLTFIGGGSIGTIYHDAEYLRCRFLSQFPQQQAIGFPQSIFFEAGLFGSILKWCSSRTYQRHAHHALLVRDAVSLERANQLFPRLHCVLGIDVVLTLPRPTRSGPGSGCVLLLRDDVERSTSETVIETAKRIYGLETHLTDTDVAQVGLSDEEAAARTAQLWTSLEEAQVVITDRLHGMIFACHVGTPCIVLDNRTGKVHDFARTWRLEGAAVHLVTSDLVEGALEGSMFVSADGLTPMIDDHVKTLEANLDLLLPA